MERRILTFAGTATKHILHALVRALRAILLTFVIVFFIAALATIVVSDIVNGTIIPTGLTPIAAAALGVAFGYAAMVTVAIEEMLRAMIKVIEMVVEESEKLAKEAAQEAEVLAKKAEEEAVRFGRAAIVDAEKFGQGTVHEVEALGHGAVGLAGGAARGAEGVVGGIAHGAQSAERAVTDRLPGHNTN